MADGEPLTDALRFEENRKTIFRNLNSGENFNLNKKVDDKYKI